MLNILTLISKVLHVQPAWVLEQDIDSIMYLFEEAKDVQKLDIELQRASVMGGLGGLASSK